VKFLVEVGIQLEPSSSSSRAKASSRVSVLMDPDSEEFQYLLSEEGRSRKKPFVFGPRVEADRESLESSDWFVLRPFFNHSAAPDPERYSLDSACPFCLRGRTLLPPGIHASHLWKKPMQFLSSGELVVSIEVAELLATHQSDIRFLHPATLERGTATELTRAAKQVGNLIVSTGEVSGFIVENGAFRTHLKSPPQCSRGHTLEPFEDGILRVRIPERASGIGFSEQYFGTAGGVWAPRPFTLIDKDLLSKLSKHLKSSKVIAEPVVCQ